MKIMFKFTILLFFTFITTIFVSAQETPRAVAFTNVTIIDVKGGQRLRDRTVVIDGNRIQKVGRRLAPPANALVIDARGKFLIPGLWDMHIHAWDANAFYPVLLANGVTGIRDMGGEPQALTAFRRQIETGARLGPRTFFAGQIIDGLRRETLPFLFSFANTADEARAAVRQRKNEGADFIKVYNALTPDVYAAIVDEAKRQNLPFAGHVPVDVGIRAASVAGQRSIEHLTGIALACAANEEQLIRETSKLLEEMRQVDESRMRETGDKAKELLQKTYEISNRIYQLTQNTAFDNFDSSKAAKLNRLLRKQKTWQAPTLAVAGGNSLRPELAQIADERLRFFPPFVRGMIRQNDKKPSPEETALETRRFQRKLEIVGAMHRAGVPLLAGSDAPNPNVYPGFSLHDELEFLVQAGLSPLAALQTATLNPATYFDKSKALGSIEAGYFADLVLLDADPLADVKNTRKISAVVANGRFLPREVLDKMLADTAAKYKTPAAQPK